MVCVSWSDGLRTTAVLMSCRALAGQSFAQQTKFSYSATVDQSGLVAFEFDYSARTVTILLVTFVLPTAVRIDFLVSYRANKSQTITIAKYIYNTVAIGAL